ncbi:hypothetical protein L204_102226 [Cryptococcus depauperatus]|nr:hypothetical protein L204_04724 [Cryptococcus depauperatus CBS 7855]
MSSLPPRDRVVDQHRLSNAGNIEHATRKVNKFAKRDPALYPLSLIMTGMLGVAGYFFWKKSTEPDATRKLMASGMVNPWDSSEKLDTHPSSVAQFKYRYKTRDGHFEDGYPTLNQTVEHLKEGGAHKYRTE